MIGSNEYAAKFVCDNAADDKRDYDIVLWVYSLDSITGYAKKLERELTNADLTQDGITVENAMCDGALAIGGAVISQISFSVYNKAGATPFSAYEGMQVQFHISVDVTYSNGSKGKQIQSIGTYYIQSIKTEGSISKVIAYDSMSRLDKPFTAKGTYPRWMDTVFNDALSQCNIFYTVHPFADRGSLTDYIGARYSNFIPALQTAPTNLTCRQVVSYIAQCCGFFVYANELGYIDARIPGVMPLVKNKIPEVTAYSCDGKSSPYSVRRLYLKYKQKSGNKKIVNRETEKVVRSDGKEGTGISYALSIKDNPFFGDIAIINPKTGEPEDGLAQMKDFLCKQTLSQIPDFVSVKGLKTSVHPLVQPGDLVTVHIGSETANIIATRIKWNLYTGETIECDADDDVLDEYDTDNEDYDELNASIDDLYLKMDALGTMYTTQRAEDGETVSYMHDEVNLADSQNVWKLTKEKLSVSTDGMKTWADGVTSGTTTEMIGEGTLDSTGACTVTIDDAFKKAINGATYQVFLQAYGAGSVYVSKRETDSFTVTGTAGLAFAWEIKK